jgi:hypothetical protein
MWNDMENMEEKSRLNCEMIWKIWKKSRLNSEMIWKIWKKSKLKSEDLENTEKNCEMIWKIQKKIVKWYGKYGRKVSEKWNDIKNMEESQVE